MSDRTIPGPCWCDGDDTTGGHYHYPPIKDTHTLLRAISARLTVDGLLVELRSVEPYVDLAEVNRWVAEQTPLLMVEVSDD